jgi:dihydrofolate reductase
MSKLVLYIATSQDGFIATSDGGVEWLEDFGKDGEDYGYHDFVKTIGSIVMGSATYLQCLTFGDWPYGDTPCFVCTNQKLEPPPKDTISFVSGDMAPVVDAAKAAAGDRDVWLLGGAGVVAQCIKADLIDTYMIFEMPVKLGSGIPMPLPEFKNPQTKTYKDGVKEIIATR